MFYVLVVAGLFLSLLPGSIARAEAPLQVTVTNTGADDVYNYTLRITLNSTNFADWSMLANDCSDVYFTDGAGSPLYYYIEQCNVTGQSVTVLVKLPSVPAGSTITIYMYYGGNNPYTDYNNVHKVFLYYIDFGEYSNITATGWDVLYAPQAPSIVNGMLDVIGNDPNQDTNFVILQKQIQLPNYVGLEAGVIRVTEDNNGTGWFALGFSNGQYTTYTGVQMYFTIPVTGYDVRVAPNWNDNDYINRYVDGSSPASLASKPTFVQQGKYYILQIVNKNGVLDYYVNGTHMLGFTDTTPLSGLTHIYMGVGPRGEWKVKYVKVFNAYPDITYQIGSQDNTGNDSGSGSVDNSTSTPNNNTTDTSTLGGSSSGLLNIQLDLRTKVILLVAGLFLILLMIAAVRK